MRKYKNAPWWWYITLLAVCVALCLVTALAWPTHLTWWALLLALLISLVMTIPIGVVQATTNIQLGLNVFTEYIIGYMLPGRPLAMMLFKTYGYITMVQALSFVQDLKLGHYMKVPPRSLFWGQLVATIWSCIVQLCVQIWALDNIADICQPHQSNRFTCPQGRVFFGASVIWGVIGPARMFSGNALYSSLQYFWIVGALSPLLFYALARIFPRSNARFLSAPVIFGSVLYIPPATPLNYVSLRSNYLNDGVYTNLINSLHGVWSALFSRSIFAIGSVAGGCASITSHLRPWMQAWLSRPSLSLQLSI